MIIQLTSCKNTIVSQELPEFVLIANMTNSTKEPKSFYSKAQTAFSLVSFFMPTFQFVLVFGILILCKIERMQTLLDQQQQLTLQTNQQIQHLQLEETKETEKKLEAFEEKEAKKGFFNRWFGS